MAAVQLAHRHAVFAGAIHVAPTDAQNKLAGCFIGQFIEQERK
jgi:hypothetical protein